MNLFGVEQQLNKTVLEFIDNSVAFIILFFRKSAMSSADSNEFDDL